MPKQYDKWTEPAKLKATVHQIEGGRALAARDVGAEFAAQTHELYANTKSLAGFVVIVWDDEGDFDGAYFNGKRSPYSRELLLGNIIDKKLNEIMQGASPA